MIYQQAGQDLEARAAELFGPSALKTSFEWTIAASHLRGLDRVSPERFEKDIDAEVDTISRKVLDGSYRFTPYRQLLRLRGAQKTPRRLAVATVRDRLVLYTLKELLHEAFPDAVNRTVPNLHIREIRKSSPSLVDTAFVKADIRSFYDSIDQQLLLELLEPTIPPPLLRVLERAMRNPILPAGNRRARKLNPLSSGVPQGLAISNILAEISLAPVDATMKVTATAYRRYVDDVLMFVEPGQESLAREELEERLAMLGLRLNRDKSREGRCTDGIDYLGYHLRLPQVTVKGANVQKQIRRLASLITAHTNKIDPRYKRLSEGDAERLLLNELNDKITGAVGEHRRYGWLFHFLEINDMTLLFRLDNIVSSLWRRIRGATPPPGLKRFVRAYYEARFNERGGYIHNYGRYNTEQAMRDFLSTRELDHEAYDLPGREVAIRFRRAMRRNFSRLEADVGFIS